MNNKVLAYSNELIPFVSELLNDGQDVLLKINGNSMTPFFKHLKTNVCIRKLETIKQYDVVLFKYQNRFFIHRIIKIKESEIICGGDGLLSYERINQADIIGHVIYFENEDKITQVNDKVYCRKVKNWWRLRPFRRILLKWYRLKH